jgi:hypothetical protein
MDRPVKVWHALLLVIDSLIIGTLVLYGVRDIGLDQPTAMLCFIAASYVTKAWLLPTYAEMIED